MGKHALERTSPKGKGLPFIGTCIKCGATDLPLSAVGQSCENPANLNFSETLSVMMRDRSKIQ